MALRQAGLFSRGEAVSSLVITPRANEAFRVRKIYVTNPSGALVFATIINDTARVGFFRVIGKGGRHLIAPNETARGENLLDWMMAYANFAGYPVVQGESLTISLDTGTADIVAIYDSYDAADIKSDAQGGSKSQDILYVNYGTNLAAIAATGYNKLDSRSNPAEMPAFPFGAVGQALVPSARRVHIFLVGGQAVGRFASAGNTGQTQYVRLRTGASPAQTILDRADVGYPFFGTIPAVAGTDYTSVRQVFPSSEAPVAQRGIRTQDDVVPDLEFGPNDELHVQVQTTVAGIGTLAIGDIDVWTLQRIFPA